MICVSEVDSCSGTVIQSCIILVPIRICSAFAKSHSDDSNCPQIRTNDYYLWNRFPHQANALVRIG